MRARASAGAIIPVFGVTAVVGDAADLSVDAQRKIAATARIASSVVSGVPAHADALAFFPDCDAGAGFVDDACYFMARNARVGNAGKEAVFRGLITETDAAGLDADTHLGGSGGRNFAFLNFEGCSGFCYYRCFHFWHESSFWLIREVGCNRAWSYRGIEVRSVETVMLSSSC